MSTSDHEALHLALDSRDKKKVETLLRRGANPNSVNAEGLTPLHAICKKNEFRKYEDASVLKLFFKINDELNQPVEVDARDKFGRTPLQLAVAGLSPDTVDVLLDRGAELSGLVFPAASDICENSEPWYDEIEANFKLRLASGILVVVERLEKRGYELDRNAAVEIMKFFVENVLDLSEDVDECCLNDEKFVEMAKRIMIAKRLSVFDLIQLQPKEAEKRLTVTEYLDFANAKRYDFFQENHSQVLLGHLCKKLWKGFCRRWAMVFFLTLTSYRLPILCCEKIIEKLVEDDVYRICLAVTNQTKAPVLLPAQWQGQNKGKEEIEARDGDEHIHDVLQCLLC